VISVILTITGVRTDVTSDVGLKNVVRVTGDNLTWTRWWRLTVSICRGFRQILSTQLAISRESHEEVLHTISTHSASFLRPRELQWPVTEIIRDNSSPAPDHGQTRLGRNLGEGKQRRDRLYTGPVLCLNRIEA
jgi:hypothetical protein